MTCFREGGHIVNTGHDRLATRDVFNTAVVGSILLRGKPVRCSA